MGPDRSYASWVLWLFRTFPNFSVLSGKFFLGRTHLRTPRPICHLSTFAILTILVLVLLPGAKANLWAQDSPQKSAVKCPKPHQDYEPLGSPACNGQVKMLFRNKKFKMQPVVMLPNAQEPEKIPFVSDRVWFCYGLKRDEINRSEGAILVKVIYRYDSGVEEVRIWNKENIGLYRNDSTNYAELDFDYDKGHYLTYHQYGRGELYKIFHGFFQLEGQKKKERTDDPAARRIRFLFPEKEWDKEDVRERSYLLFYSGVGEEGTWIPFWVGIDPHISRLLLTVVDLSQTGSGEVIFQVSRE